MKHYISNETLDLSKLELIINEDVKLEFSEEAVLNIERCYTYFSKKNTTSDTEVSYDLLRSYACGIGECLSDDIVKLMLLLKIQSLSFGFSGVRLSTVRRLLDFYNNGVYPALYMQGSPDDRISLAHLSLPLVGEGEVRIGGKLYSACELEELHGWKPLVLKEHEQHALLTGTQLTTAHAVHCLIKSLKINDLADYIAASSALIFKANAEPYSPQVHLVHPHKGQILTAQRMYQLLEGTDKKTKEYLPEAFTAIPQVHGAVKDAVAYVRKIIRTEVNSSTDNPLILPEHDQIIYGGNSHTLPLSFGLDFLAIVMTGLGNISERRTFHLISNVNTAMQNNDKNLDLWVLQRMAEGISAQNRMLAMPASVENPMLVEKHTDTKGMGGSAAMKCYLLCQNIEHILALELLAAYLLTEEPSLSHKNKDFLIYQLDEYFKNQKDKEFSLKKNIEKTIAFLRDFTVKA
ncbi:MAG: aromatic amino acid ammonia-lyase [Capnocytophaga sp.]|nr:aromatic amino acid ammonia-lyase [Capnocytophaga sp.]